MGLTGAHRLHWSDFLLIGLYFALSIGIGVWTIFRKDRNSVTGFFLAGRNMVWWPIGMSVFASNIGAINFVGIAGSGAASGFAVIMFEWNAVFLLILLGWVFIPVYIGSGIYTIPEYMERRFGGRRLRIYLSIMALLTYLLAHISIDLYTGAIFVQQTLGWNIYIAVAAMLLITATYCALGGLTTVILTDALAVVIMIVGGFMLFIIAFIQFGSLGELETRYMNSIPSHSLPNTTCGQPRDDAFHIFRGFNADFPALGTFLRTTFGSLWFWCTNQVLVQRVLAAKTITHAKAGCIFAAFLKLTPFALMVLPGVMSRALYPEEVACGDPDRCLQVCGNPVGCSNIAYPELVIRLMPNGLRGLMIAVMVAAVVSSLTSIFNSASTIFAMDIWKNIRTSAKDRETLIVSKVFVVILATLSVAWIPIMENAQGGEIYKYATSVVGYCGAPLCATFLLAIFWNRVTEPGAFWGTLIAQTLGILRVILDSAFPPPTCAERDTRPAIVARFNGYDYTVMQVAVSFIMITAISLCTKPPPNKQFASLTFWTRFQNIKEYVCEEKVMGTLLKKTEDENNCGTKVHSTKENPLDSKKSETELLAKGDNMEVQEESSSSNEEISKIESDHYITWLRTFTQESTFWKWSMNIGAAVVAITTIVLYIIFR